MENRNSLPVNSPPYFLNPVKVIKINLTSKSADLLQISLPEVIDNENNKI